MVRYIIHYGETIISWLFGYGANEENWKKNWKKQSSYLL